MKQEKLESFLGGNKKEGENKICPDAISYINENKKEVIPKEKMKDMYTFSSLHNYIMKAWVNQKANGDFLRFFDENENVMEVKLDYDKLYDRTSTEFNDLDEEGIKSTVVQKLRQEMIDNGYYFFNDPEFKKEADEKIDLYKEHPEKFQ